MSCTSLASKVLSDQNMSQNQENLSSVQQDILLGAISCMHAGVGKPFFEFGTEPPACQLQCWSLEPYLKQWLLQAEATRNMPSDHATGAFLGSLVGCAAPPPLPDLARTLTWCRIGYQHTT